MTPVSIDRDQDRAALYAQHYLGLVRLARQFVDDLETAEDVVQDVFAALPATTTGDPLRYLRTAVLNRCRSALRRRRTVRTYLQRTPPPPPDDADAADHAVLQAERDAAVLAAIAALPRRQQEVVVLRFYEDLSVAEVAAVLGIRAAAVSTSTRRALSTLGTILGGERDH